MRAAVLPFAVVWILIGSALAGEAPSELAERLLQQLGAEQEAMLSQTPPRRDRAAALQTAVVTIRKQMEGDGHGPLLRMEGDGVGLGLQKSLGDFPELAKLADEWDKACLAADREQATAANAEMIQATREAMGKARFAQAPGELDEAIASLAAINQKYGCERLPGAAPGGLTRTLSFLTDLQRLLRAEKDGLQREALEQVRTLFQREVRVSTTDSDRLAVLDAHARKLGVPSKEEAEGAIKSIIGKAMAASQPADLDPLREEIERLRKSWLEFHVSERHDLMLTHLTDIGREFVLKWQDFLMAGTSHDSTRARASLTTLLGSAEREPVYPRAALLEAQAKLPPRETRTVTATSLADFDTIAPEDHAWLATLKTLDDLVAHFPEIQSSPPRSMGMGKVSADLRIIKESYEHLKAGDPGRAKMGTFGGFNAHPKVVELRNQLTLQVAAAVLHAGPAFAPRDGESPREFVLRVVADAQQRKDWPRLQEITETLRQYPAFSEVISPKETVAVHSFIVARNFETAGVWASAVSSYMQVLNSGSTLIPAEEVATHVEAIRRAHPAEYKRGSGQTTANMADDISVWPWVLGIAALLMICAWELKRRLY